MDKLVFEPVAAVVVTGFGSEDLNIQRAKVPGGWLVLYDDGKSITFYPDPRTPGPARVCHRRAGLQIAHSLGGRGSCRADPGARLARGLALAA